MRRSTVRGALPWEGKDRNMRSLLVHAKAAKAVITPKGAWTKRARQRGNAHCALGAIEEVLCLVPETAELDGRGAALIIALPSPVGRHRKQPLTRWLILVGTTTWCWYDREATQRHNSVGSNSAGRAPYFPNSLPSPEVYPAFGRPVR